MIELFRSKPVDCTFFVILTSASFVGLTLKNQRDGKINKKEASH